MKHVTRYLVLMLAAATLVLSACRGDDKAATATNATAAADSDSGGSRKGDFGPPQGKPIDAVLT